MAVGPRGAWERSDGGDGDFTVEIVVEISPGIVLRSRLWMAVGDQTMEMERRRQWDLLLRWGVIYGGAGV
uniref:Uncharacterized protein n=1 Tax=Fagus sylvatica TaxID=28930 RepID=A0A2N9F886_FAGSY